MSRDELREAHRPAPRTPVARRWLEHAGATRAAGPAAALRIEVPLAERVPVALDEQPAAAGAPGALAVAVVYAFEIEASRHLPSVLVLAVAGFAVQGWLPASWRLWLFVLLSLASIGLVLEPRDALCVIGLGLAMIGVCRLPVAFALRVALLLLIAGNLAYWRSASLDLFWPVLGAMFMFRLVLYMRELRREKEPASVWQRVAYFFLLPNVVFLLFPIVDYRTYLRTYVDRADLAVYGRGVRLLFRGVVHLLAYRLVYHAVVIPPHAVGHLADVVRYVVSFWLLYLRISGQFHIVIGMLCLFGFNLPETNHLYYLASSFTDLWRRTNIYWKDFMQNVFYFTFYTRFKRLGRLTGVVLATLGIFVVSWLLHSYQWLWLRGEFPIRLTDMLFWGLIGLAVAGTVVWEMRRRTRPAREFSLVRAVRRSASVVGMFLAMSLLWSLWSSSSVADWWDVVSVAGERPAREWWLLIAALAGVIALGTLLQAALARGGSWMVVPPARARAYAAAASLALLLAAQPGIQRRLGPVGAVAASFGYVGPNALDVEREMLGYYEGLLDASVAAERDGNDAPPEWAELPVSRTADLRSVELVPGFEGRFKGAPFRTNRWGMRDREYTREKPPGTFRIAVLGSSVTMGSGVGDGETFESLAERALNERGGFREFERVELLNFGMAGHSVLQEMRMLDAKALSFEPDMILCVVHANEDVLARRALRAAVAQGRELGYPWLEELVRQRDLASWSMAA